MSGGLSVVVPCYNSARRIPETLEHLASQRVPTDIPWEVILVDNASTDPTAELAEAIWREKGPDGIFRVVPQPIRGLSAARAKGFEAARYDYVLFCDDDNWLSEDYVARAHRIMEGDPIIGALGGRGIPHFEIPPPDWWDQPFRVHYGVGPQGPTSGDVTDAAGAVYGAGFVIRKEGWERLQERKFEFLLSDRQGGRLTSGGDTELCFGLRLLGYRIWYDQDLTFQHFIPRERLTWRYFLRLVAGSQESTPIVMAYKYALGDVDPSSRPPTRHRWRREAVRQARRLLRRRRLLLAAARNPYGMEGDEEIVELHRRIGRLKGWLRVRGGYAEAAERLSAFGAGERRASQDQPLPDPSGQA
jgi:glycosyltransferase involved in cell wall biosynthesis